MRTAALYFLLLATSAQAGPVGTKGYMQSLEKRHGFNDGVDHAAGGGNGRQHATMDTKSGRLLMNLPNTPVNNRKQPSPSQSTRPGREAAKELDDPSQSAPKFEGLRISTVTQTVTPIPVASTVTVTAGAHQNSTRHPSAAAPSGSNTPLGDGQPCVVLLGSDPQVVCGGKTMTPVQITYGGTSSTSEPVPAPNTDGNGVGVSVISLPTSVLSTTTSLSQSLASTSQTTSATPPPPPHPPPPPPPPAPSPSSDSSAPASQTTSSPAVPPNPPLNVGLPLSDSIALGEMGTTTPAAPAPASTPDAASLLGSQPIVNLGGLKLNSVLDLGSLVKATPAAKPPA